MVSNDCGQDDGHGRDEEQRERNAENGHVPIDFHLVISFLVLTMVKRMLL